MKQNRVRLLVFWGIFLLAAAWTWVSRSEPGEAFGEGSSLPHKGFRAPDFTLPTLAGDELTLSSLQGKVVILNFWATWCLPCRAEMPALQQVYQDYRELGLEIVALNVTDQDSYDSALQFVGEYHLTFPVPLDLDGSISSTYDLRGMPTTYFIDRAGIISDVVVGGPMSEALLRSKVEELLKGLE